MPKSHREGRQGSSWAGANRARPGPVQGLRAMNRRRLPFSLFGTDPPDPAHLPSNLPSHVPAHQDDLAQEAAVAAELTRTSRAEGRRRAERARARGLRRLTVLLVTLGAAYWGMYGVALASMISMILQCLAELVAVYLRLGIWTYSSPRAIGDIRKLLTSQTRIGR